MTTTLAVVLPPCNLVSNCGLRDSAHVDSVNEAGWDKHLGFLNAFFVDSAMEAVTSIARGPDGTPVMAVGCGATIPILSPIDGAVGLSVVRHFNLLMLPCDHRLSISPAAP